MGERARLWQNAISAIITLSPIALENDGVMSVVVAVVVVVAAAAVFVVVDDDDATLLMIIQRRRLTIIFWSRLVEVR